MQTPPIQKLVQITPIDAAQSHGPWQVDHGGQSSKQKMTFPVIDLPQGTGPYLITFQIVGDNPVKFDPTDPIWVKAGSDPKPSDPSHKHNQILTPQVIQQGKVLTVSDPNTDKANLHYRLNFVGDSKHQSLDPIIKNGGGTTQGGIGTEVAILIVNLVVLAAVLFVAFRLETIRKMVAGINAGSAQNNPKRDTKR